MPSVRVVTDSANYAPGSTAVITGSGFQLGETVQFQVQHLDGSSDSAAAYQPWTVTDGGAGDLDGVADGKITTNWSVSPSEPAGTRLVVTATGSSPDTVDMMMDMAATTFTVGPASSAGLTADKADYQPGEVAVLTGSGFQPGETVQLQVLHTDGAPNTGPAHDPWLVTDGGAGDLDGQRDGKIRTTWYVDPADSLNATLQATAVGLTSGATAQATFTDATPARLYLTGDNGTSLLTVDPATGVATRIGFFHTGNTTYGSVYTGAFTPDGTYWTIVNSSSGSPSAQLATVDLSTASVSLVGPTGVPNDWIISLDADNAGNLYAGGHSGGFYSVNKTTGQMTRIGTGVYTCDFTFDSSGTLWAVDGGSLLQINTTTGAATNLGAITGTNGNPMTIAIDPVDNTFYIATWMSSARFYRLNTSTRVATQIGSPFAYPFAHGGDFLPIPSVSGLSQTSASEGSAALTLTVNGANFGSNAVVQWNGAALATTFVSGTQLRATVPASDLAEEGTDSVTVLTPVAGSGASNAQAFTVSPATPALSGPGQAVRGVPVTFTASDPGASPADQAAGLSYTIDWGDGTAQGPDTTVVPASPNNGAGVSAAHTYSQAGTYAVRVTATDDEGNAVTSAAQTVTVADAGVQGSNLYVNPADSGNVIHVSPGANNAFTISYLQGASTIQQTFSLTPTGPINIQGPAGGSNTLEIDSTSAADNITLSATSATVNGHTVSYSGIGSVNVVGNATIAQALTGLSTVSVTGAAVITAPQVTTTGAQSYGALTLGADATLQAGGDVSLGAVDGHQVLTVSSAGKITVAAAVGGQTPLARFVATGSVVLGAPIHTTGDITINGPVTLTADDTLTDTGTGIIIDGSLDSDSTTTLRALTLNTPSAIVLGGPVGAAAPLASLTTGGGGTTAINGGSVTTAGVQSYGGPVTLGADATLTGSGVTFNGDVSGAASSLTVQGATVLNTAGVSTGTGAQTYDGAVSLTHDATLTSTAAAGIAFNGDVTSAANSLTVAAAATLNTANVNTGTGSQSYNGALSLTHDATLTGGSVLFGGAVNGHQVLTVNATGTTTFAAPVGGATGLARVVTGSTGQAVVAAPIRTTGDITFNNPVTLTADLTLTDTGTGIYFNSTVDSDSAATPRALTLDTPTTTLLGGAVGAAAALASLTTDAGGTTEIDGGSVTTTGTQTYGDAVTLGADTMLAASAVSFTSTLAGGGQALAVTGNAVLGGAASGLSSLSVSGAAAVNGGAVSSTGTQTYSGAVSLGADTALAASAVSFGSTLAGSGHALAVTGDAVLGGAAGGLGSLSVTGATAVNGGSVTTSGAQTYGGAVTLGADAALAASTVSLGGTLAGGGHGLAVTGNAVLGGAASGLSSLSVSGTTAVNGGSVASTGAQTYTGAVSLGADAGLAASDVSFGSTVAGGSHALTVTGNAVLSGAAGGLSGLSVSGAAAVNGGAVSSTGAQNYGGAVTLGADTALAASAVAFASTVAGGGHALAVTGNAVLGGEATGLTSLSVSGATAVNTDAVTTSGAQTYAGAVTLGATTTLTASAVTFDGDVTGAASSLTVAAPLTIATANVSTGSGSQTYNNAVTVTTAAALSGANVTFDAAVSGLDLTVSSAGATTFNQAVTTASLTTGAGGTTAINGGSVTTSGGQTYGDAVVVGVQGATLASTGSGNITFNGTVDGAYALAVNSGGVKTFNAPVGAATPLASLSVDAAAPSGGTESIQLGGSITTTGSQTFTDPVLLTANVALTAGGAGIAFQSTVDSGPAGANGLTISSPATSFGAAVGGSGALASLTTLAGGTTALNGGSVTTTGNQTYGNTVTLGAPSALTTTAGGGITFGGTLDGNQNLTLTAGSGNITFAAAVGSAAALRAVTVASAANVTEAAGLAAASLAQLAGSGTTALIGPVTTSGAAGVPLTANAITVNAPLTTAGAATFTNAGPLTIAAGANITTGGAFTQNGAGLVTTAGNLTAGGDVRFAAAVTLTGPVAVHTAGAVAFGGHVVGGAGTDLTIGTSAAPAGAVTFAGTVNGAFALTVYSTGTTTFLQTVGGNVPLRQVISSPQGTTDLGAPVYTSGDQTFNNPVYLTADVTLLDAGPQSTGITFNSTVDSLTAAAPHALTVESNRPKTFNAAVGSQHPLASLTTEAADPTQSSVPTQLNGGAVDTTGDQHYNDALTLGTPTTFNASGSVVFGGTVTGQANIKSGGNVDASGFTGNLTIAVNSTANTPSNQVVKAGQGSTTIVVPPTVSNSLTLVGGGQNSQTTYQIALGTSPAPSGQGSFSTGGNSSPMPPTVNIGLVSQGGANIVDLSGAALNVAGQQLGVTLDLTKTDGTPQAIFQPQLANPDIGSLLDPSLRTSDSQDSLSLLGNFQQFIIGSGATLFAAPSTYDPTTGGVVSGTTILLTGTGNTVYGAPGATVASATGGNTVIEAFGQTQAGSYLAAGAASANAATFIPLYSVAAGSSAGAEVVTFLAPGPQPTLTASAAGLTGTNPSVSVATTTAGALPGTDAVQTITFGGSITGGTFTLSYAGATTPPIAWSSNASTLAANIQAGLNSLALFSSPAAQQAFLGSPSVQQALIASPTAQQAFLNNPATEPLLLGNPATAAALLGNPTTAAAILGNPTTAAAILGNPTTAAALLGSPQTATALLGSPQTAAAILGNPTTAAAILGNPTTAAALLGNPTAASALLGNPTAATALLGNPTTATALLGNPTTAAAILGNPTTAAAILGNPTTAAAILGNPTTAAALLGNPTTAAAILGNPTTAAALLGSPGTAAALLGNPATAAAILGTPQTAAALLGNPTTASAILGNPTTAAALLANSTTASAILGNPAAAAAILGSPATASAILGSPQTAQAILGSPATAATILGSPGAVSAILGNPTTAAALLGSATTASAILGNPTTAAAILGNPATAAAILGNPTTATALLGNPQTAAALLGSPTTAAAILGNPTTAAALLGNPATAAAILGNPTTASAILGNPSTVSAILGSPTTAAAILGNPTTAAAILGNPTTAAALLGNPTTAAALLGNTTTAAAILGNPTTAAALLGNPTTAAALLGNATTAAALLGNPSIAAALLGSPGAVAAILGNPTTAAAILGSPTTVSAILGSPSTASAILGNPTMAAALLGNPGIASAILGNPTTAAALLGSPATAAAILGNPQTAAAILGSPTTAAAILGSPQTAQAILGNPTTVAALLADPATASVVLAAASALGVPTTAAGILGSPSAAAAILGSPTTVAAILGDPATAAAILGNPTTVAALLGNSTTASALLGNAATAAALLGNPTTAAALLGNPQTVAALLGTPATAAALLGSPTTVAAILGNTTTAAAVLGNPTAAAALLGSPTTVNVILGNPTTAAALLGNPTTAAAILGNPTTAAALLGNPTTAAALLGNPSTVTAILGNPTTAAALLGNATIASAILGSPTTVAAILGNPTTATALLGSPTTATALLGAPATVTAILGNSATATALLGNPTTAAALLGNPTTANALLGNATTAAAILGNPQTAAAILGNPSTAAAILGNPTIATALLGNASTAQAILGNPTTAAAILGSPTAAAALLGNVAIASAILGNPTTVSAILGNPTTAAAILGNPSAAAAILGAGKTADLLLGDPATAAAILGTPAVAAAILGNPTTAGAILGSPTTAAAVLGNPATVSAILGNPTAAAALLGTATTAAALLGSPTAAQSILSSTTTVQAVAGDPTTAAAVLGNPATVQAIASNPANAAAILGAPTTVAAILASPTTVAAILADPAVQLAVQHVIEDNPLLGQQILSDPNVLRTILNTQAVLQVLLQNPAVLQPFFASTPVQNLVFQNPNVAQQVLLGNPLVLEAFFNSNPDTLTSFLTSNPGFEKQVLTAASLGQLQFTANLAGGNNEVSGGFLSKYTLGSGSLFREQITPAELAFLDLALSQDQVQNLGIPTTTLLNNFQSVVTVNGGNNVLVGGLMANFTATGGGNNRFVVEDPNLLGIADVTGATNASPIVITSPNHGLATGMQVQVSGVQGNTAANGTWTVTALDKDHFALKGSDGTHSAAYAGGGAALPAALSQFGGTFTGTGGNDTFYFAGGASGYNFGNVTLNEPSGAATTDTLDFSSFQGGGVNLNLAAAGQQQVAPGLALTLPGVPCVSNVIGSPGNDSITGNGLSDTLQGAALDNSDPYALPAVPTVNPQTQWVYLDFTDFPVPPATEVDPVSGQLVTISESLHNGTGAYSAADEQAILAGLQSIYAPFNNQTLPNGQTYNLIQFTLDRSKVPANTPYETVFFDSTPIVNGKQSSGGLSSEIDFRNLNRNTSMQVDINGFLGNLVGLVPDTVANFQNLSIMVTAHELAHTLGLRHEEAFGPVGFGISNPPGPGAYYPAYPGLVGAFTTTGHVITSPDAVGSTLQDAASGRAQFGEREAVSLAFIYGGTVVQGTNTSGDDGPSTVAPATSVAASVNLVTETAPTAANPAPGTTTSLGSTSVSAQPVSLYTLNVPNPITSGFDAGKTFDVAAVDVLGRLTGGTATTAHPDFYTFQGQAGDLMNFEVKSAGLTRISQPIDSVLYVYGPDGNLVAWNDDQFEPSDSSVLDLPLLKTGTYTVEVDSFQHAVGKASTGGDYELFMYRTANYNTNSGNDTFVGGTGNATMVGGNGSDSFTAGTAQNVINGGAGKNTLTPAGGAAVSWAITSPNAGQFTSGTAAATFSSIQNLVGTNGNDTFVFAPAGSLAGTIDGKGGTNTLDYAALGGNVTVDLPLHQASLVNGFAANGLFNVQNVNGSQGNDILVGDANPNVFVAGAGRSILIGETGADKLVGGAQDDILIAGRTSYDTNLTALNAILSEWVQPTAYNTRVNNIMVGGKGSHNGQYLLNKGSSSTGTVLDNTGADAIVGTPANTGGMDLIFYDVGLTTLTNRLGGEKLVNLANAAGTNKALLADGSSLNSDTTGLVGSAQALASGPQFVTIQEGDGSAVPADVQARIDDALGYWTSVFAPQGVTFTEVPASSAGADFRIDLSPTSVLGGVADGVLGVTTADGTITLVTGWDWYTGSDPAQIGSGQYDLQTITTHELGHALGLGHSTATASVMYPYLAAGAVQRSLAGSDVATLGAEFDATPQALRAAPAPSGPGLTPAPGAAASPAGGGEESISAAGAEGLGGRGAGMPRGSVLMASPGGSPANGGRSGRGGVILVAPPSGLVGGQTLAAPGRSVPAGTPVAPTADAHALALRSVLDNWGAGGSSLPGGLVLAPDDLAWLALPTAPGGRGPGPSSLPSWVGGQDSPTPGGAAAPAQAGGAAGAADGTGAGAPEASGDGLFGKVMNLLSGLGGGLFGAALLNFRGVRPDRRGQPDLRGGPRQNVEEEA